jgi:hypothetical protein
MMTKMLILIVAGVAVVSDAAVGQQICPARIQWQQTYGGIGIDEASSVRQTSDGGFIIGGSSYSPYPGYGNRTAPEWGGRDFWIVRTDAAGSNLWDRAYGSLGTEGLSSFEQTSDGGFILAGYSSSLGTNGNKTANSYGLEDMWLVRTDSSGNKLWDVSFGGRAIDWATSVRQTSDGGFVVAGASTSPASGNKSSDSWGGSDFWVVRFNAAGAKLWDRSFGGDNWDAAYTIRQTSDGGFVIGGYSNSGAGGNKTAAGYGFSDFWLVRLDGDGNKLWDRAFGGDWDEELRSLVETPDGGFLLAGRSYSFPSGSKTSAHFGYYDWWVIRVDGNGAELWQRSYGGTDDDILRDVNRTADGGFILSGSSRSSTNGTKTSRWYGRTDYWMVRINGSGEPLWDQTLGTRGEDDAVSAQQTADGGFIVAGTSYDRGGNKTSPTFGNGDFWVVKLQAETPGDCDGDGVPDALDLCADTPPGTIVNSNGCAIVQLCPCTNDWRNTRDYLRCVRGAAREFVRAGLITEAERLAIVEGAENTNCPPDFSRPGIIAFGLTNVPIGQANLNGGEGGSGSWEGGVTVSELGVDGLDGVSVLTGEADSGVFLYPDAPIWGDYNDLWFMLGKAYGRLNGAPNSFVSSLRVTKPGYETYPVAIDLTGLAPRSLTFQVFSNRTLVAETTTDGTTGGIIVYSDTYLGPRGNPFWRMPDGSVGAIIEVSTPVFGDGEYQRSSISGPFGDVSGDRVFIRANQPANSAEFISRVDVTGFSGEFNTFSFLDERLGVFARPHKALGPVTMTAARGQLTLAGFTNLTDFFGGVLVELDHAAGFDVNLRPLELANANASLTVSGAGAEVDDPDVEGENDGAFAQAIIRNQGGVLALSAYFSPVYFQADHSVTTPALLQIKVYRNGALDGSVVATNDAVGGTLVGHGGGVPEILGFGLVTAGSNLPPHFALSLRREATFTAPDGRTLRGNQIRIEPVGSGTNIPPLVSFSMGTFNVPAFTITGEQSVLAPPPISVVAARSALELRWPNVNQPFLLEAAPALSGPFSAVTNDVEYIQSTNCLKLPVESAGSRFFRLRLSTD